MRLRSRSPLIRSRNGVGMTGGAKRKLRCLPTRSELSHQEMTSCPIPSAGGRGAALLRPDEPGRDQLDSPPPLCPHDSPGSGGRYDPISNTWRAVSSSNAPPGTSLGTAVWTGTQMLVWGGTDFYARYSSGGRYNPRTDTWLPISSTNAPSDRYAHTAVW